MKNTKIALITGASRGIGLSVAKSLANAGYLVLMASRDAAKLNQALLEIEKLGGNGEAYSFDVSDYEQVQHTIQNIVTKYGQIDVLFNNAGVLDLGTVEISPQKIKNTLRVNLEGAIFVAGEVAKQMKKQKSGYIINLASISGKSGTAGLSIYNASKFGLCGFSEALAKEMAMFNVKVSVLCPAMIATEMTSDFNFEQNLMIEASDIAKTVEYLLSLGKNAVPSEIIIKCMATMANQGRDELEFFNLLEA